jgi:hypothetical protein
MIQKTAPLIHFTFEVRTEFIDAEMAELFATINCSLQLGLQSVIPEVLSNVNRSIDPDKYAEKISMLNSAGVVFGLDLIYGLPGDTLEGFKQSLDYALMLQPNHLDIFPLAVLPGTALYDDAAGFGLQHQNDAPYILISSPGFTEVDMAAAGSLKSACEIFYNQGGAAGWMFMVTETLAVGPADLIEEFVKFTPPDELTKEQITGLQLAFVQGRFRKHDREQLFPVIEDIIIIHGAMNRSLYAGPYSGELSTAFTANSIFKLSPGTVIAELNFDFNDLMTVGELDLDEYLAEYTPQKNYVIIYNCGGEVKPLIVNRDIAGLLKALRGGQNLESVLEKKTSRIKKDAYEFIEYGLSETLIYINAVKD